MGRIPTELRERIAGNIKACRMYFFPGRGGAKNCAEAFGVSPQQWSPWERGMRTPDELRLTQIGAFFGVNVEWIRSADCGRIPSPADFHHNITETQQEIWTRLATENPSLVGKKPFSSSGSDFEKPIAGQPVPGGLMPGMSSHTGRALTDIAREDIFIAGCYLSSDERSFAVDAKLPPNMSALIRDYIRIYASTVESLLNNGIIVDIHFRSKVNNQHLY